MKTRQEMIYEFGLALASNPNVCDARENNYVKDDILTAVGVLQLATELADQILESN